ncbi:unnamed protein product [Bursaphelenchus okinawaensis]|uniref:Peptide-N(4)-(N-acetyl-beta-glucosaminyl)asparagine amidase n=1 Tax=Bursaphelenchus okinawaensis TaxID=465554 RepID=A0A811JSN1_9BILA|nr:unnamed protein product [Bursaphelenchus okinawaensis]CAG9081400.1 unnamed protein product [Bursaphelenchus okinawaensis]
MVVEHVNHDGEWPAIQQKAGQNKLLVVDFYADWCGPCRMVAPHFEQLSNQYKDAVFVKVNVDYCNMVSQMHSVRAMPTFVLFLAGKEVGRVQGADIRRVESIIQQNYRPVAAASEKPNPRKANHLERQFLHNHIVSVVDRVKEYEDEITQTLALSVIPLDKLKEQSKVDGKVKEALLAKNLMKWFHDDFFRWLDQPECCKKKTTFIGDSPPSADERQRGADKVEVFNCTSCNQKCRFARFNNPATLIETREGRCGEWANCFALFCRAVGLETRYVISTEDHVWVEIYDPESKNWIHLDPCENVIDRPLLYEKGWNKEFKYVFGIAKDHVQDVTWRYTFHHKATLKRRRMVREPVLLNCLTKLNQRLQKDLPAERREELRRRQLRECIQFLNPKLNLRDGGEEGRKSGGLAWKLARMETNEPHRPVEINLSDAEKEAKKFVLEYDVVNDVYHRPKNNEEETTGFFSYLNQGEHIQRKTESDWKMVYICRKEGTKSADLSWRINFGDAVPKKLSLNLGPISLFQNGKANATLCGGNLCQMIDDDGILETDDLEGADHVELSVNLRGGEGDQAFQHAQVFRTSQNEPTKNFRIEIGFE